MCSANLFRDCSCNARAGKCLLNRFGLSNPPAKNCRKGGTGGGGFLGSLSSHSFSHFFHRPSKSSSWPSLFFIITTSPPSSLVFLSSSTFIITSFVFSFVISSVSSCLHIICFIISSSSSFYHLIHFIVSLLHLVCFFHLIGGVVGRVLRFGFLGCQYSMIIESKKLSL